MIDNVRKLTPLHDTNGRFSKGNPGRPKGAVGKFSRTLLSQVKEMGPCAIDRLREAVAAGEKWAVEFVLSHVLPGSRTIEWHGVEPEDIREAITSGEIGADEADKLASALVKISKIEDLELIRERLDELEQAMRDAK